MTRKQYFALGGILASVAILAATVAVVHAQQKGGAKVADPRKRKIELATEALVARSAAAPARAAALDNPKVAPGKVTWHADLAAACAAARKSGKPVLLFQMMGRLDQQFC